MILRSASFLAGPREPHTEFTARSVRFVGGLAYAPEQKGAASSVADIPTRVRGIVEESVGERVADRVADRVVDRLVERADQEPSRPRARTRTRLLEGSVRDTEW